VATGVDAARDAGSARTRSGTRSPIGVIRRSIAKNKKIYSHI